MTYLKYLSAAAAVALFALVSGCADPGPSSADAPKVETASAALTEHGVDRLHTVVVDGVTQVEVFDGKNDRVARIDYLTADRSGATLEISHAGARYQVLVSADSVEIRSEKGSTAIARYDAGRDALEWDDRDSLRDAVRVPLALVAVVAAELHIAGPWQGEEVTSTFQSRDRCSDGFWACSGSCRRQFSAFWDKITGNLTACLNACGAAADACYGQNQGRPGG